jgi:hypothetical protein
MKNPLLKLVVKKTAPKKEKEIVEEVVEEVEVVTCSNCNNSGLKCSDCGCNG